ncbi:MAG: hypothetical protein WD595_03995 [Waddliaceae bacterium]
MAENLVVISKVKSRIKQAGMNTSTTAIDALSKIVDQQINKAIEEAKKNKRKTVMDRDFSES